MGLEKALARMRRKVSAGMQALSELASVESRARQAASTAAVVGSLRNMSTSISDDSGCGVGGECGYGRGAG